MLSSESKRGNVSYAKAVFSLTLVFGDSKNEKYPISTNAHSDEDQCYSDLNSTKGFCHSTKLNSGGITLVQEIKRK